MSKPRYGRYLIRLWARLATVVAGVVANPRSEGAAHFAARGPWLTKPTPFSLPLFFVRKHHSAPASRGGGHGADAGGLHDTRSGPFTKIPFGQAFAMHVGHSIARHSVA
jgi:hypothetical protein